MGASASIQRGDLGSDNRSRLPKSGPTRKSNSRDHTVARGRTVTASDFEVIYAIEHKLCTLFLRIEVNLEGSSVLSSALNGKYSRQTPSRPGQASARTMKRYHLTHSYQTLM